jgi:hypothetical protein
MTVYNLGTVVVKAKLLDEAINLMIAAGNLGVLRVLMVPTRTPEEDGPKPHDTVLIVEGHTPSSSEIKTVGRGHFIKATSTPFVTGEYTVPVVKRVPSKYNESIGRGVFVDLVALQKIVRATKVSTDITLEITSDLITIWGVNFKYTLQTARNKKEQSAISERQISRQYKED